LKRFTTTHKVTKDGLVIFSHLMTIKPSNASIVLIHETY
jgi:hypothetical protein